MNSRIFLRLSRDNIKKNAKMYVPYILTCVLMTAMIYIIRSLSLNPDLSAIPHGGATLPKLLKYGSYVTSAFAIVIVFYSNSFILQRRSREFGLLNILGMEKRHIAKLLLIETLMIAAITFVLGIAVGIGLERLITGLLANLLGEHASKLSAHISMTGILDSVAVMAVTFVGVFLFALRTLHFSNPIELLSAAGKGEKEPKTKLFMTIVGVLMLLGGYTLSFFVADPRMTLHILAAAVLFVILGTYFIFIAAIIAFLKLLKKNKRFYYKTKHFTSVSGLIYRMKRNCVGLASVTILSTMVLISVSSTSSLMLGIDIQLTDGDAVIVTCNDYNGEVASGIEKDILERVKPDRIEKYLMAKMYLKGRKDHNFVPLEKGEYEVGGSYIYVIPGYDGGIKSEDKVTLTVQAYDSIDTRYLGDREEDVLFKKDPADIKKEYYTEKGEIVIESKDRSFDIDRFEFFGREYKVRKYVYNKDGTEDGVRITVATNEEVQEFIDAFNKASLFRSSEFHTMEIYYKQPIPDSDRELKDVLKDKDTNSLINGKTYLDPTRYRSEEKAGMMLAFGSLFFLGVFLGTLFVLETVLIIYYKQLTEGYEDAGRFRIMQNVGMSEDEVRSTIRSQILLVFFLPLVFAMLHTVIAFPMVGRLLAYIGLDSTKTYLKSCAIGFAGYFVLYTAVYLLTAKLYYRIIRKQR